MELIVVGRKEQICMKMTNEDYCTPGEKTLSKLDLVSLLLQRA